MKDILNLKSKYKVKRTDPPTHKFPIYYYLVDGTWTRYSSVPEVVEYKKHVRSHPTEQIKNKKRWNTYYNGNKEKLLKKGRQRKKDNKERYWNANNTYNNTEYGYIMNLYSSALAQSKRGRHGKNIPTPFEFTKESWWKHWLKQKEKHGMKCPYSNVTMTHIRGTQKGKKSTKKIPTNISKDQVWPGRGYTPDNLVFCTVKFNLDKKSITPAGCQAVVDVHQEMMDRLMTELTFKRDLDKVDATQTDKNGESFITNEFKKLGKMLSKKEWKVFAEIAYQRHLVEREKERPYET